jgi:hypothetical protein
METTLQKWLEQGRQARVETRWSRATPRRASIAAFRTPHYHANRIPGSTKVKAGMPLNQSGRTGSEQQHGWLPPGGTLTKMQGILASTGQDMFKC